MQTILEVCGVADYDLADVGSTWHILGDRLIPEQLL